jgi:hypothetical protein
VASRDKGKIGPWLFVPKERKEGNPGQPGDVCQAAVKSLIMDVACLAPCLEAGNRHGHDAVRAVPGI